MNRLRLNAILAMLALAGCGNESAVVTILEPPDTGIPEVEPPMGARLDVTAFGATPDDQTDDTHAFEATLAALPATGGTVLVPAGVYLLSAIHSGPNRAIDLTGKRDITISGAGATRTILRMAPATYQGDTHMILIQDASGTTLEGFTLDGNRAHVVYRDEQSHGVQVVSSVDTHVRGMTFQNLGGDGVRLFGASHAEDPWTERILIEDSHFQDNTRNGISIQRAARFVEIRRNTFDRISDQSISSEPSGAGAPTDVVVEDNVVRHTSGAWAIALAGIRPADVLRRLVFRNNRIENGAAYFLWTDDLVVEGNVIDGDRLHSPLRLHDVSEATVTGNEISGQAERGTGVVQVVNHDNGLPSEVTVSRNTIEAGSGLSGIHVRDASGGIEISENVILGDNGNRGVVFNSILVRGEPRVDFRVKGNEIRNFATAVSFLTRGDEYREVEIRDNVIDHDQSPPTETVGILFSRTGPFEVFASILANIYGAGIRTRIQVTGQ